jgi:hypothetical protein
MAFPLNNDLYIHITGNTGAGEDQPCSDFFGPGRICLHFTPGLPLMNLPEGTYVHDM